jgi:hypothetical protein
VRSGFKPKMIAFWKCFIRWGSNEAWIGLERLALLRQLPVELADSLNIYWTS